MTTIDDLHGTVRRAEADEIRTVRGILARTGAEFAPDETGVVFAYPGHGVGTRHGELSGCTAQVAFLSEEYRSLVRLGMRVAALSTEPAEAHAHLPEFAPSILQATHDEAAVLPHADLDDRYLLRWTMLLGGRHDGVIVEDVTDSVAHSRAVIDLLTRERLSAWADAAGLDVEPELLGFDRNGADSAGIAALRAGRDLVAKTGPRAVIEPEAAFIGEINEKMAAAGLPPLFPEVLAVHRESRMATLLMERAHPETLDESVFTDAGMTALRPDAATSLRPHLALLDDLYRATRRPERPTVAEYLYRQRFDVVVGHPGFVDTFAEFFPAWDAARFLTLEAELPDGTVLRGYTAATGMLDAMLPTLLPDSGCLVHGDVHLKNMLVRMDGSPVFVDPRTIWDGIDRPDVGYGDPAYDYATLLHSLLPMSAVLAAVADGTTDSLGAEVPEPGATRLDARGLKLPLTPDPVLAQIEAEMAATIGGDPAAAMARLRVGAANALAGWLKYGSALATPQGWLAVYIYVLWYLDRAQQALGERA
ncbi:hypothetical protein ABH926_007755 [Catenulispora sp. GP43]|uniref:phosphotransferase n=1 Tax=Catenulispora sp. GP43 TaxID=3156263 RepID=UPI0035149FE8